MFAGFAFAESYRPVHAGGVLFFCGFLQAEDFHLCRIGTKLYFDDIAYFDICACFYDFPVQRYASRVAGFICNGTPLYNSGNFQKFINPHFCRLLFRFKPLRRAVRYGSAQGKSVVLSRYHKAYGFTIFLCFFIWL